MSLNQLLTKDDFHWNDAAEMAFKSLKTILITPPILNLLNFTQRFVIECDANGIVIRAFSEALKSNVLSSSTYEK